MAEYTVYSEAGGTYKTSTVANCARGHVDQGLDTLCIDLDHQKGNLSRLFDVADQQNDSTADNLVLHMLNEGRGDFYGMIRETEEGIDILPAHNKLEDFKDMVVKKEQLYQDIYDGEENEFNRYQLLADVLNENNISDHYDVIIVDPNARAELSLYNALYATGSIVAPVEFGGKGALSIEGLEEIGGAMSSELGVQLGVVAIVPNNTKATAVQKQKREEIEAKGYDMPVVIGERESLMKEMWNANGSAFKVMEEAWFKNEPGNRRERDAELRTMDKLRELSDFIADQFGLDYEPLTAPEVTA